MNQAISRLHATLAEMRLQRENEQLVNTNREMVEKEYAAGQASLVRLNEAQRNLVQAQRRLALARVSLHSARYNLDVATGRNMEKIVKKRKHVMMDYLQMTAPFISSNLGLVFNPSGAEIN